ncbi:hypothetical protein S1OALGB6SA_560 [Olavius algarvensis spirochete endosymbiont]|nr:MAG: hypothetical protein [Olavius algarvensis spirochete endosymbiont]VDA99492.1 hypothetical protein S1OALGB6SA_560 [Olavius algarvensis spirochete endosymbiont]
MLAVPMTKARVCWIFEPPVWNLVCPLWTAQISRPRGMVPMLICFLEPSLFRY